MKHTDMLYLLRIASTAFQGETFKGNQFVFRTGTELLAESQKLHSVGCKIVAYSGSFFVSSPR